MTTKVLHHRYALQRDWLRNRQKRHFACVDPVRIVLNGEKSPVEGFTKTTILATHIRHVVHQSVKRFTRRADYFGHLRSPK
ncbi:MAG: hypothetical protein AAGH64_10775, partial [Planctomycetota bacterium]